VEYRRKVELNYGGAIPDNEMNGFGREPSAVGSCQGMTVAERSVCEDWRRAQIMDPLDEFAARPVRGFDADRHMHYDYRRP
jgi:hypothetical protein